MNEENIKKELIKTWENDKRMINFCMKEYKFIKLRDFIIEIKKKPSIYNEILYNDEYKSPEITKEKFINYNMDMNFNNNIDLNFDKNLLLIKNYDKSNIYIIKELNNIDFIDECDKKLFLTDNEKLIIKKEIEILRNDYLKRLNIYWKKYKNKIYTHGYWANR